MKIDAHLDVYGLQLNEVFMVGPSKLGFTYQFLTSPLEISHKPRIKTDQRFFFFFINKSTLLPPRLFQNDKK